MSEMRNSLSAQEKITFVLLFGGYMGYYLTRKDITIASVAMKDLSLLTIAQIGYLSSAGTFCYALGKFINGFLADRLGGKKIFLTGMIGSVAATTWFAMSGGFDMFLAAWAVNSYFLSMGWVGLVKVMSYWFGKNRRGTIMGYMTLNFQIGSSAAKTFTALLMGFPLFVWRGLFLAPAAILLSLAVLVFFLLKEKPDGADGEKHEDQKPAKVAAGKSAWAVLLKSRLFLLILWGSAAITLIRTFFDDFAALWLNDSGMATRTAGFISALFTIGGMAGSILAGYISDRFEKGNRGPVMVISTLMLAAMLLCSRFFPKDSVLFSALFFSATGFFLFGVYSILSGVSAIDFGGTVSPSTAAGIIDGVGYLAAASAGLMVSKLKTTTDWEHLVTIFALLTLLIALSLLPLWRRYPTKSIT
jgi:sugar phosphate permease